ncbi:fasciclin domain-containing protein [Phycicoccus endophyticus]|uniref:Fasciclin domain-containing protein n=1 Tax=Phycicoccus endophyticus TaxID=1690220 RepID=A0A7G9R060_9MICO|nr:fasciclin domain-containing protein [Phycicoccus endophyticus]NHI20224.1 fasciclin domain-containing protein [Phycicoccus endophyticus]QNN48985.1 fasciclin domain-containing protein [Phycicoccus endophyticus]
MRTTRTTLAAVALALPLALAACGSDDSTSGSGAGDPTSSSAAPSTSSSESMGSDAMGEPFGAACADVPQDGAGSFDGMAEEPVATAASNNPVLSTLVTAVGKAGLGDTLNSAEDITVFAPANSAFEALPKDTMDAAMADPKGLLTDVLTNHVVEGRLSPDELPGEHQTLGGGTIEVMGSGEDFTVDPGDATVVCGNVQTANATVYIIDQVLVPEG